MVCREDRVYCIHKQGCKELMHRRTTRFRYRKKQLCLQNPHLTVLGDEAITFVVQMLGKLIISVPYAVLS